MLKMHEFSRIVKCHREFLFFKMKFARYITQCLLLCLIKFYT